MLTAKRMKLLREVLPMTTNPKILTATRTNPNLTVDQKAINNLD
jgi:hypothetical protein